MEKPPSPKGAAPFHQLCHDLRVKYPNFFLWPLFPSHSYWAHDYPDSKLTNSSTPCQLDRTTLNDFMTGPKFLRHEPEDLSHGSQHNPHQHWTKKNTKTPMPVFEQQESSSYAALVCTIESTEVESGAFNFTQRWGSLALHCATEWIQACAEGTCVYVSRMNKDNSFFLYSSISRHWMWSVLAIKATHRLCCCLKISLDKVSKSRPDTKMNLLNCRKTSTQETKGLVVSYYW